MRLYKRTYGLRQICNIAVYMVHSACTIHLLNLPEKTAKRDIAHGVKHLEEIAEDWLCARRTLSILSVLAKQWGIELPEDANAVLKRTDAKFGVFSTADVPSPKSDVTSPMPMASPPRQLQRMDAATYYGMPGNSHISMPNSISNAIPSYNITQLQGISPVPSPRANGGALSLPPDEAMQMSTPYERRHYNMAPPPAAGQNSAISSGTSTSTTLTGKTSQSTMFGGVDALVENQDWWLRDQVDFAADFGSWHGNDIMEGLSNGSAPGAGPFLPSGPRDNVGLGPANGTAKSNGSEWYL